MHSNRMHTAHSSNHLLGRGCLPQYMLGYPLGVGLETPPGQTPQLPPGCGPGDPQARPLNFPSGCGSGDLQGILGYHPPGDLQGMLGYHLQCMLGYHPPPVNRMTDRCKNDTLLQTSFAGREKFFLGEHQSFIWGH